MSEDATDAETRRRRRPRLPTYSSWEVTLAGVLADTSQPRLVAQPIVDLARGMVVGYEMLSRFDGPPTMGPDKWFQAAAATGYAVDLEMRVFRRALTLRNELPANCFLTVNVSPDFLASPDLDEFVRDGVDLSRIVLEITENERVDDYVAMTRSLSRFRERGALVAIDDAGAGYASLQHVLELRPDMVKLDRGLVSDIDQMDAKRAVVEMLGALTSRIDAWLLAEGIERRGELEELLSLGVPLGQGYFLGRPGEGWPELLPDAKACISERNEGDEGAVALLIERRPTIAAGSSLADARALFASLVGRDCVAVLDEGQRPLGVVRRRDVEEGRFQVRQALLVAPQLTVPLAAQRAMLRDADRRFDDLICRSAEGRYLGVLSMHRVVEALAR